MLTKMSLTKLEHLNFQNEMNHSEGFISTVEIRRLKENIILLPITIKGKDSRFGFGFRLGNHADIQTIFEIGPQKYTNKPKEDSSTNSNKRMTDPLEFQSPKPNRLQEWINDFSLKEHLSLQKSFSTKNQYSLPSPKKDNDENRSSNSSIH